MGFFELLPIADWRNEGWTPVGVSTLSAAWNNDNDALYVKAPATKGRGEVQFPVDTSSVPEGAVITSVSVYLRCARVGSDPKSVTVNVLAADDEARFTSRTFYPDTTINTFEVATYTRDPLGFSWDVHRLNQLRARVFSLAKLFDAVRCYKFFVRCNYHTRPKVTVTGPTGTVRSPSPTISWTYTQDDGDAPRETEYKVYTASQVQSPSFNPDYTDPVYRNVVTGDKTSEILPTSINPDSYVIYLRAWSVFGARSKWASRSFEVRGPAPAAPGNDNAGVSGVPGVGVAEVVGDSYATAAHITMRDASNLLSVQAADFEVTTDHLGWLPVNASLDRETVNVYTPGLGSLKITTTTAGTVSAVSEYIEVAENSPVTVRAQVRAAATSRTATVSVAFFDDQYASLGSGTVVPAVVADSASTWTEMTVTGRTPAGTMFARITISFGSTALSEVHYVDRAGLMYGAGSAWSHGGHQSRNLLSAYVSTADVPPGGAVGTAFATNNSATTVARTTTTGTGSHGTHRFQMTYVGLTPTITAPTVGTNFTSPTSGADFTLNKPTGVVDGDLLLAFVTTTAPATVNVPTGWTLVNGTSAEANNGLYVLKRSGLAADPASWAGTFGTISTRRSAVVLKYSGAALADDQFAAEAVRSDPDGNPIHTTATITNSAANAWRIGCFVARDDVTGGTMTANINPPTIPPDPVFVGRGAKWGRGTNGTDFTINRPASVQSGDLMVASVTTNGGPTMTVPAGWTLVRRVAQSESGFFGSSNAVTLFILKRTAGSSEPAAWTGTLSSSQGPTMSQSVAYRNVKDATLQFLTNENGSTDNSGTSIQSATINNPSSKSLRISVFASNSPNGASWTSSDTERADDNQTTSGIDVSMAVYDSNTTVATGDHTLTGNTTDSFYGAVSWIGLISGLDTVPSPVANETERRDFTNGSSDPAVTVGIYDSNGVIGTGPTSLTATFSGSTPTSVLSWIGIIKPLAPVVSGDAAAKMVDVVDISKIDPEVLRLAENKISVVGSFLGSAGGTPYLTLDFYRANQLISSATAEGSSFGTSVWSKSGAVFTLPEGCTRLGMSLSVRERSVGDTVSFDRMSIAMGESLVYRNGTGRDEHPVWSHPEIQYADDDGTGYGEWRDLLGVKLNPPEYDPFTGWVVWTDHTIVPLHLRKYRTRTISYGLAGDKFVSDWGPETDEISVTAETWWLKDIKDPNNNLELRVKAEPTNVKTIGTATKVHTMGAEKAKVVGDGYKGDEFELTIICTSQEHAALKKLIKTNRTLFLQSDVDHAWWIRPIGDFDSEIQATNQRKKKPLRFVRLVYVEVNPEE